MDLWQSGLLPPTLSCVDGEGLRGVGRGFVPEGGGVGVWRKAIQSLRLAPSLRPSAEWYPTHAAKSAS